MRARLTLLLALATVSAVAAAAEEKKHTDEFNASYVISLPTAGTHDFISNASFAGIGLDGGWFLNELMTVGFSVRWTRFSQDDPRQAYTQGNVTVTGEQFKALNAFPVMARFKSYLNSPEEKSFTPYVALGIGSTYVSRTHSIGTLSFNHYGWQFAMAPEIGILKSSMLGPFGTTLSVRYDGGFGTDSVPAVSALSFAIGVQQAF